MPLEMNFDSKEEFLRALRDWFAGQALAGLLGKRWDGMPSDFDVIKQHAAKISFEYADAMLAERSKQ